MEGIRAYHLASQAQLARELAAESDLLEVEILDPEHILARFHCRSMLRSPAGGVEVVEGEWEVGFWLPEDYLRRPNPLRVATWLGPTNLFNPNVAAPTMCLGPVAPGTRLDELIYRSFDLITWNSVTVSERDALDWEACAWARRHRDRYPVEDRPLKWRRPPPVGPAEARP